MRRSLLLSQLRYLWSHQHFSFVRLHPAILRFYFNLDRDVYYCREIFRGVTKLELSLFKSKAKIHWWWGMTQLHFHVIFEIKYIFILHTKAISPTIVLYFTTFHSHRPLFSTWLIWRVPWNNSHQRVSLISQVANHTRTFNKQYNDLRRHVQNWISQSLLHGIEGTRTR